MRTEAQKRADRKYKQSNTKKYTIELNKNNDSDIIEFLDQSDNRQGLIKSLIRAGIKKED